MVKGEIVDEMKASTSFDCHVVFAHTPHSHDYTPMKMEICCFENQF